MKPNREQAYQALLQLSQARYSSANIIYWAGSIARGEGNKHSDLDIIVVHERVPHAYREAFEYQGWPVDAFIHDPETLRYFYEVVDKPLGIPALPAMIWEGVEIPGPSDFSADLKAQAKAVLDTGPTPLTQAEIDKYRFFITDFLQDIQGAGTLTEKISVGVRLYEMLPEFFLRAQNYWVGKGKSKLYYLALCDEQIQKTFIQAFESLFTTGEVAAVTCLVDTILAPYGGLLWAGYRAECPPTFRQT